MHGCHVLDDSDASSSLTMIWKPGFRHFENSDSETDKYLFYCGGISY